MKVREMMHKGLETVAPETPVTMLAKKMKEYDVGAIPIEADSRLVGMVTDRDIAIRAVTNGMDISKLTAKDVMTKEIISCRDDEDVNDAVRLMESKQIRRLPVLDKDQKMVGMLSLGDISHAMSRDITAEVAKSVSAHHR
jgi:CBS domain-containing protein